MKKRVLVIPLLAALMLALAAQPAAAFFSFLSGGTGYATVGPFSGGLACVQQGDKYGYINTAGELVIPCTWEWAGDFCEGRAWVQQDGLFGYIDATGKLIAPCLWDGAYDFSEGMALVYTGDFSNQLYGFLNLEGELVLPCQYEYATSFQNGMAYVENGLDCRFIAPDGSVLLETDEFAKGSFHEGFARYSHFETKGAKMGYRYGFIDSTGRAAIPAKWENAGDFSEGLAPVCIEGSTYRGDKWGYIDTTGAVVIPYAWSYAYEFLDGFAVVWNWTDPNHLWGLIDKKGHAAIPLAYEWLSNVGDGFVIAKKNDKWGVLRTDGSTFLPFEYEGISYGEGLFCLLKRGKLSLMDAQGHLLTE